MRLKKWIESLYKPSETNFREAALDDLVLALNEPAVRKHWLSTLVEELRAINVGVDRSLDSEKFTDLQSSADRRRAIVFCLNQILDSQQAIETQMFESRRDNHDVKSPFEGVAVQRV